MKIRLDNIQTDDSEIRIAYYKRKTKIFSILSLLSFGFYNLYASVKNTGTLDSMGAAFKAAFGLIVFIIFFSLFSVHFIIFILLSAKNKRQNRIE